MRDAQDGPARGTGTPDACGHCGKPVRKVEAFVCRFCAGTFHRECCDMTRDRFYLVGPRLVSVCVDCMTARVRAGQASVG